VKTNGKALDDAVEMYCTLKGSKLLKGTNLVVPGQNIAFSSEKRLIQMLATEK